MLFGPRRVFYKTDLIQLYTCGRLSVVREKRPNGIYKSLMK